MNTVHWLGAGLSTVPGIRRLANSGQAIKVWNRTRSRASDALAGTMGAQNGTAMALALDFDQLAAQINPGDVVVSMLPGDHHVKVAKTSLGKRAHFVSSSYLTPEMTALHADAVAAGVSLVNEVGLDPGIDHLFAHALVEDYRTSPAYAGDNKLFFRSYCGGVPAVPNDFRYKFSWSPFGVLKALTSPATWLENGDVQTINTPWKAVTDFAVTNSNGHSEIFEAYPNRDSLPFIEAYQFDPGWQVEQFVRGTLRLAGWSQAWRTLFNEIESMTDEDRQERLGKISDQLWSEHAYAPGERDRVVLVVELEARNATNQRVWQQSRSIDDTGNEEGTSMARLVSHTVSLAVQSTLAGDFTAGVQAAPSEAGLVRNWLHTLAQLNGGFEHRVTQC